MRKIQNSFLHKFYTLYNLFLHNYYILTIIILGEKISFLAVEYNLAKINILNIMLIEYLRQQVKLTKFKKPDKFLGNGTLTLRLNNIL